ncbi:MAG: hypothetical protein GC192_09705 [Bacteroidetes bacterium]|nr:hypothetical protein [Bacteroidota bacterium]
MKKNYDIRLNPQPLSKAQIAKYKDFDGLLEKCQAQPKQRPIIRRLIWVGGAIAASLTGIFLIFQLTGDKQDFQQRQQVYLNQKPYVDQPLLNVKPSFASFKIDPSEGGIYKYPSGSQLVVPAAAFVNDNGETLSGEVTLHYREMHDFVDFFVSGIPMTYDSAGVNYNLESAGMIEIFAEQNGKRVKMAPGKNINVELVSNVNTSPSIDIPPGYNIYKLDENKRNWVYQNIDRMQVIGDAITGESLDENSPFYPAQKALAERMLAIQVSEAAEVAKLEKTIAKQKEPTKPQRANSSDYVFNLDLNDIFTPSTGNEVKNDDEIELRKLYKKYSKMLWQLSPEATISPERLQKEFSTVTGLNIKKINERAYELELEKGGQSTKVLVTPVLSGSDYDKALAEFNQDYDNWKRQTEVREAKLATQRAAIAKRFEEEKKLATLKFEERINELRSQGLNYAANNEIIKKKVVNRFTASEFGIWNCDRPLPPEMLQLAASFKDSQGKPLTNRTAYLVDKSRNTVYQFLADKDTELRFNKNSENLLWLITDENKIAVFRPEQFKAIASDKSKFEFVMESVEKEIKTEQDIREILYL